MTKVFIGGSRGVSRLNDDLRRRLDNIVRQGLPVLVGDANGADKAVQRYLRSKNFDNVEVFCSGMTCRNNEGCWKTRNVAVPSRARGAQFYSEKDRVMAKEASVGLMIWDGESAGTLLNVLRLTREGKIAVMYSAPEKNFLEFRSLADWDQFIGKCSVALRRKIEERVALEPMGDRRLAGHSMLARSAAG